MADERETLELDVVFVGAGPASLAGAYWLANRIEAHNAGGGKLEAGIAVLEKGKDASAHALSGAVFDPRALKELFPDDWQSAPVEAPVGKEKLLYLTERGALSLPIPPPLNNHGCSVASLGKLMNWLSGKVQEAVVDVFYEFPAAEALVKDGRVVGVRTGDKGISKKGHRKANYEPGIDVRSRVVVLGEGPRGTLAKRLEAELGLTEGKNPQIYAIGIKEIWELPAGRIEPGQVVHTMGWPLGWNNFGGGFLYGMKGDQAIVGLVAGLDYENPYFDPHREFQRFKTHPEIAGFLEGGKMTF